MIDHAVSRAFRKSFAGNAMGVVFSSDSRVTMQSLLSGESLRVAVAGRTPALL
jgi:hypothetical protein